MGIELILDEKGIDKFYEIFSKEDSDGSLMSFKLNRPFKSAVITKENKGLATIMYPNRDYMGWDLTFETEYEKLIKLIKEKYEIQSYSRDNFIINSEEKPKIKVNYNNLSFRIETNFEESTGIDVSSKEIFRKDVKFYFQFLQDFSNIVYQFLKLQGPNNKIQVLKPEIPVPEIAGGSRVNKKRYEDEDELNYWKDEIDSLHESMDSLFGISKKKVNSMITMHIDPVRWSDVGGLYDAKEELKVISGEILDPESCYLSGKDPYKKKGYLLLGPPGCGKTYLVQALANELILKLKDKVKVYHVSYNDIGCKWRGAEKDFLNKVFQIVSENEERGIHSILFIDELQSTGKKVETSSNEAHNSLLVHLDGVKKYRNLTVIGATHTEEDLEDAFKRRFPNKIRLGPFDDNYVKETFEIYINKSNALVKEHGGEAPFKEIDYDLIVEAAKGFLGDNIAIVINNITTMGGKHYRETGTPAVYTTQTVIEAIKDYKIANKLESEKKTIGYNTKELTEKKDEDIQ